MSLGSRYKSQYFNTTTESDDSINSFEAVTLTVWERYPVIASSEFQEIYVMVLDGGTPLENIDLVLRLTMPDGSQQSHSFAPTGRDGQTRIELGPIDAASGTLIVYNVCLDHVENGPDCITDDYLIWGAP
jgi:hypothetical protein